MQKIFILLFTFLLVPVVASSEIKQLTTRLDFRDTPETTDQLDQYGYKWDKENLTLTLKGLNMLIEPIENNYNNSAITLPDKAIVKLIGENTITHNGNFPEQNYPYSSIRQLFADNTLNITGENNGSLILKGNATNASNAGYLIESSYINISNVTIIAKEGLSYKNAIHSYKSMQINDSKITIDDCGETAFYGNDANKASTIKNSTIKVLKSGKAAIRMNYGDLAIENSSIEIGETTQSSHAISANKITISNNSKVTVDKAGYTGIYATKDISINNCDITINKTGYAGLFAGENISISNGSMVAIKEKTPHHAVVVKAGNDQAGTITVDGSTLLINDSELGGITVRTNNASNKITVSNSYIDVHCSSSTYKCFNVNDGQESKPTITNSFVWEKDGDVDAKKTGTIYGEYTLNEDLTIQQDEVLVISQNAQLTTNHALTNNGEMQIRENSTFKGNGTFIENNEGTQIVETLTEDMISVPQDLKYTGEDLSTVANSAINLSMSILGETVPLEANDWKSTIEPTEVKNAGTYTIKYTKEEKTVSKTFEVAKADKAEFATPELAGSVTYGVQLSTIDLPEGWKWEKETDIPTVTNSGYSAIYTVKDYNNYNWTKIEGYQEDKQEVTRNITVSVTKATGDAATDYTEPSGLSAIYGQTLADVRLPEGWTWDAPETSVGNVITNPNSFVATFTPDDLGNYEVFKKELLVTVNKADLSVTDFQFEAPNPEELVYDGNKKAASITTSLIDNDKITIKYKENASDNITSEIPTEAGTYTVIIDVAESDNYNKVTDMTNEDWTFTIIPVYTITIDPSITNGTIKADKETAQAGETVTLTVSPATNHQLSTLSYSWTEGSVILTETTIIMPAGNITVTATFSAIPVTPPVPTYYTVTLPAIEGVTTDPAAGSYEIESWDSFGFFLTLAEGYQKDSQPVVTADGKTLVPRISDGKYIITNVINDTDIEITGIIKDIATSNELLPSGFHITTSKGLLLVTVPYATSLYLNEISGRLILTRLLSPGDNRFEGLAAGVYILTIDGRPGQKVLLK